MKECSCHELLDAMGLYIDGEAAADVCEKIDAHLATCADCRLEVETLRKTILLVHDAPKPELSGEARERLFRILNLDDYLPDSQVHPSK